MMVFNQSGLFFVPQRWQSASFIRWLKRVHAWTGFWGAMIFLLMGTSGFLLNHRAQLKIDTGEPVEVSQVDLPVAPGTIRDADGLGKWARAALHLPVEAQRPRGGRGETGKRGEAGGRAPGGERERGGERRFAGIKVETAETWSRSFMMPDGRVTVDYVPGANHVSAQREAAGFFGTIKNMHKGVGMPIAWVLFLDTIAGALITMALTGFLLWTRLHGSRLLAGALAGGALIWALAATIPQMG